MMMWYTLDSRRTDVTLCDLHEFLCLYATDIHEAISERVSGAISTSAVLLDVTVMSSSGVIVSPSDVPVEQLQPLTMGSVVQIRALWPLRALFLRLQILSSRVYSSWILRHAVFRNHASRVCYGSYRLFLINELSSSGVRSLPRTRRRGGCRSLRRLHRLTVSDLSSKSRRV